nr:MAG TPA: hypothetical protein [Caudoviricetes sp.]
MELLKMCRLRSITSRLKLLPMVFLRVTGMVILPPWMRPKRN